MKPSCAESIAVSEVFRPDWSISHPLPFAVPLVVPLACPLTPLGTLSSTGGHMVEG